MNRSRTDFEDFALIPSSNLNSPMIGSINKYWLLGFVEGEGTFGIKNMTPYFQIGQHNRSVSILNSISLYLERLGMNTAKSSLEATVFEEGGNTPTEISNSQAPKVLISPIKTSLFLNSKTNVNSMTINSIDTLYYHIVPFFESLPFQTRKKLDFSYWVLCVKLHKFGYYTLSEGKQLIIQVSNFINKNRYTNKKLVALAPQGSVNTPDLKLIDQINSISAPFDISTRLTHTQLAQEFARKNGSRQGFKEHIYENCLEIPKSPFSSYSEGHKAISLRS
jgi:hypothetical protein